MGMLKTRKGALIEQAFCASKTGIPRATADRGKIALPETGHIHLAGRFMTEITAPPHDKIRLLFA